LTESDTFRKQADSSATSVSQASPSCREFAFFNTVDLVWRFALYPSPISSKENSVHGSKIARRTSNGNERPVGQRKTEFDRRMNCRRRSKTHASRTTATVAAQCELECRLSSIDGTRNTSPPSESSTNRAETLQPAGAAFYLGVSPHTVREFTLMGSPANSHVAIARRKRFPASNPYRSTRSPQVC
jgi:hypothetical protein